MHNESSQLDERISIPDFLVHSLADAANIVHRPINDFLNLAISRKLSVIVAVPKGVEVRVTSVYDKTTAPVFLAQPDFLTLCQHTCVQLMSSGRVEESDFLDGYLVHSSGKALTPKPPHYGTGLTHRLLFTTFVGDAISPIELVTEELHILHDDFVRVVNDGLLPDRAYTQILSKGVGKKGKAINSIVIDRPTKTISSKPQVVPEGQLASYKELAEIFVSHFDNDDHSIKFFKTRCSDMNKYPDIKDACRLHSSRGKKSPSKFDVIPISVYLVEKQGMKKRAARSAIRKHCPEALERFDEYYPE